MYLATEINKRLLEHSHLFQGRQAQVDIARNLQKVLKPFHVKVKVLIQKEVEGAKFLISGAFFYDRDYQPIHIYLHFPPSSHGKFKWKDHWNSFKFLVSQVLQHEMIHQTQCQHPLHNEGYRFDYGHDDKDIQYFSELDEIDAFGHDIAMEIKHYYPKQDPYHVLKNITRRPKIISYRFYKKAFARKKWFQVKQRLLKKAFLWLPYVQV